MMQYLQKWYKSTQASKPNFRNHLRSPFLAGSLLLLALVAFQDGLHAQVTVPYTDDFSSNPFDNDWTQESVVGSQSWSYNASFQNVAFSAFAGGCQVNENWLITPAFDLSGSSDELLSFDIQRGFAGDNDLEVLYSTDYSGSGDPNTATWTSITTVTNAFFADNSIPNNTSATFGDFDDLDGLSATAVYVAFKFDYDSGDCATWRLAEFSLTSASAPVLEASPNAISALDYTEGNGPSDVLSYELSASSLDGSGTIEVSVDAPFEISDDGSSFAGSLSLNFSAGELDGQPVSVFVRLGEGEGLGNYSALINHVGGGAELDVAVSGSVSPPGYFVDFEGPGETKSSYATGTVNLSGIDWEMTEALIGNLANDFKNGERSARSRGYGSSVMSMIEDKSGGIGSITFEYARYGTDAQVDHVVEYSSDAGATWTQVGDAFSGGASPATFSAAVNVPGDARIRIRTESESGTANRRLNIDDLLLTDFDGAPVALLSGSPGSLSELDYNEGEGPSASQSYTLSAQDLDPASGSIEVEAPANFELSTDGDTWSSTLSLSYSDGGDLIADSEILVRLEEGLSIGSYSGVISHNGGGASLNLSVSGEVFPQPANFLPELWSFTEGDFGFDEWDGEEPAGTYPPSMRFYWSNNPSGSGFDREEDAPGLYDCSYNLTSRSRINGLGAQGISFIATGNGQFNNCSGDDADEDRYVGSALVGLSTTGETYTRVEWKNEVISRNAREFAIRLQYRLGDSGSFTDFGDETEFSVVGKDDGDAEIFSVELPGLLLDEAEVYLRWVYYELEDSPGGQRPEIALDNIFITNEPLPDAILSASVVNLIDLDYIVDNGPSAVQSYTLEGTDLSPSAGTVDVLAPDNFEVSLDGDVFATSVEINYSDASFEQQLFVRLAEGLAIDTYFGNVVHSGGGAVDVNVALSGEVFPEPTPFLPSLFELISGDYTFDQWDASEAPGTYPANMRFYWSNDPSDGSFDRSEDGTGVYECGYDLSSRPRFNGNGVNGISLISTGSPQRNDCVGGAADPDRYVGSAAIGLNTAGVSYARAEWVNRIVDRNSRNFAMRLQYRIGGSGVYTDFGSETLFSAEGLDTGDTLQFSFELPAEVLDEPEVYLRWVYYQENDGEGGARPEIGLDNILITTEEPACPAVIENITAETAFCSIQEAIDEASPGDTLLINAADYTEPDQIVINKDLTLQGLGKESTILRPGSSTTVAGNAASDAFVLVEEGNEVKISDLTLDGDGFDVHHGIQSRGELIVDDVHVQNISHANIYRGRGIVFFGGSNNEVNNSSLSNIQRIGIHVRGNVLAANPVVSINNVTYTGKGDGDFLDYAVEFGGGGQGSVDGLNASECRGQASTDNSTSAGILVTDFFGTGTEATITNSDLFNNTRGMVVGFSEGDGSIVSASGNRIFDNVAAGASSLGPEVQASNNWWGDESGPQNTFANLCALGNAVTGDVVFSPWCSDDACSSFDEIDLPKGPSYGNTLSGPITVGSGISNENMAVTDYCDIELGIKAFRRFRGDITPSGSVYQAGTGLSPQSAANEETDPGRARWNYLYSVDLGTATFEDLQVFLEIDFDPAEPSTVPPYVINVSDFLIGEGLGGLSSIQDSQNLGFDFWQLLGEPNILPFDPYAAGQYDFVVRVEDENGLELAFTDMQVVVDCAFILPEDDIEAPVLTCPADYVVDNSAGVCSATISDSAPEIFTDNCDTNLSYEVSGATTASGVGNVDGLSFNVGESTVTYFANDGNGNDAEPCTFTVTVVDVEDPSPSCVDLTLTLDSSGAASIDGSDLDGGATDNCGIVDIQLSQSTFGTADYGDNVIEVTFLDAAGNSSSCFSTVTVLPLIPGDEPCFALPIECSITENGSTVGASFDEEFLCDEETNTAGSIWYSFTAEASAIYAVDLCGSDFDTKVSIFEGSCDALICVGANDDDEREDDSCGLQSYLEFEAVEGMTYYIMVHGFGSAEGNYSLTLTCPCLVNGGVLTTTDPTSICVNTGSPTVLNVTLVDNFGPKSRWGITEQVTGNVIASRSNPNFNLDTLAPGAYRLTHLSFGNDVSLAGVTNVSQLEGCFDFSNSIFFTLAEVDGGTITTGDPTTVCVGTGSPVTVNASVSGAFGPLQGWGLLDEDFNVLEVRQNNSLFNLDGRAPGLYRIFHASYAVSQDVQGISNISEITGCLDNSNGIIVNATSCAAASLSSQPNPSPGPSDVSFTLSESGHASLEVYDLSGKLIRSIFNASAEGGLDYRFHFDGSALPNGVYLYRLTTKDEVLIDKFMIAR